MADSRFVKLLSIPKSIYVSVKLLGWGGGGKICSQTSYIRKI